MRPGTFFNFMITSFAALLLCAACTSVEHTAATTAAEQPNASWAYAPEDSGMTFVTIHNGNVGEINTFREISGTVAADGSAELIINLDSIDSANEARDQFYRAVLFDTARFPDMIVAAKIDFNDYKSLAIGERYTELLDMTINLRGFEKTMSYYVMVTRLSADSVLIENKAPLVLNASDFGMLGPLAELQNVEGVHSITPVITATLSFVFEK